MTPRKKTELASRLDALGIDAETLAAIIRRPVEEVETWIANGPDAEAKVLLRVLDNPVAAELAAERIRRTYTRSLRGDAAELNDLPTPGYAGGYEGRDAVAVPTAPPLPAPTPRPERGDVVKDGERIPGNVKLPASHTPRQRTNPNRRPFTEDAS